MKNSKYYEQYLYTPLTFKSLQEFKTYTAKLDKAHSVLELYEELSFEKFLVDNPRFYFSDKHNQRIAFDQYIDTGKLNPFVTHGQWLYLPWNKSLIHILKQPDYLNLRTVRNRNLISKAEQQKLYNQQVSVAGLSVGLNILLALVRHGIGNHYHIADFDRVSLSNINRSLYGLKDLNKKKTDVAVEQVHAIDPYIDLKVFQNGLSEESLPGFVANSNLIIDVFDNFELKIKLRKLAKKERIPVISGFDVNKGALLIVERYDTEKDLDLNLFLNNYNEKNLFKETHTPREKTNLFINVIGREYHDPSMLDSVLNVGNTLTGYPQLIIATLAAASLMTLAAENILLGKNNSSFRKFINLSTLIG